MYKVVIGLEVHCELKTNSKNFSSAKNTYSDIPNSNTATIDLGFPGILPVVNKEAIRKALMMAIAFHCETPEYITFDRKNYFYPDLPKGYQITQMHNPVGINGYVMINVDGEDKKVLIHDTHLEEDTASLDHYSNYSLIDYNRAGIPLLETVTEPCLYSAKEAITFLETIRNMFLYCDTSEVRSDRGQIRCDVNISLMKETDQELGTKVEIKNINSFYNVKQAIEYEIIRQTEMLDRGEKILQETRRYDTTDGMTYSMRSKVDAVDYKYFVEPNLPPIKVTKAELEEIKKAIPLLPYERINGYMKNYELSRYDASVLAKDKDVALFFDRCIELGGNPKAVANWITTNILGYLNNLEITIKDIYLTPEILLELISLTNDGTISSKQAKEVFQLVLEQKKNPKDLIKDLGMVQISDDKVIKEVVHQVLDQYPEAVIQYKSGKRNILDFLVGQVMKLTKGQANPAKASAALLEEIEKK